MEDFWLEILKFTLLQSLLSAGLSVLLGGALARFLWRNTGLRLEGVLTSMGALIFVMPVMIPALGFIMLFDNFLGESLYGLGGIILVHVFLNSAYCVSQIRNAYGIFVTPSVQRQCDLLGLTKIERLRCVEFPALRATVASSFLVVFCLSLSSFSSVLLLGGGPAATTLSVALYHALSVSFDLKNAAFFLGVQLLVSLIFSVVLYQRKHFQKVAKKEEKTKKIRGRIQWSKEIFLGTLVLLYFAPLGAVLKTLVVPAESFENILGPLFLTLAIGGMSGLLVMGMTLGILIHFLKTSKPFSSFFSLLIYLFLSVPKIVLVGSIFLITHAFLGGKIISYFLIIVVSLLAYLPFCLKSFLVDFKVLQRRYGRQIHLLKLSAFDIFKAIIWPYLHQKIRSQFAITTCFAMGNLSIPLVLGQMEIQTLPVLTYQAFLRYDMALAGFYMACLVFLMGAIYGLSYGIKKKKKGQYVNATS